MTLPSPDDMLKTLEGDFEIFEEDDEPYRVCPDCYETRKLSDFWRDDCLHDVCSFCSPPSEIDDDDFDSDEGARISEGFSMMGID